MLLGCSIKYFNDWCKSKYLQKIDNKTYKDTKNDDIYYCIINQNDLIGRRFNDYIVVSYLYDNELMNDLLYRI